MHNFLFPTHQDVPSSAPNITATKDKQSFSRESDCAHVHVCLSRIASVASGSPLRVPALLRRSQTELQPKAPPRLHRTGSGLFCFTGSACEAPVGAAVSQLFGFEPII